ncbi:hypothetical protein CHS0354_028559 [Potamilus streckersoni]|uniref:TIMELESS-interacting protein n=1 Tax=Potamilus streckersoni TaxID=2493646 RepID=A0AAE0SNZ2_9BIVA|nr:hypothetical protein CHS0354_028559 [Potamilus streckersoni]
MKLFLNGTIPKKALCNSYFTTDDIHFHSMESVNLEMEDIFEMDGEGEDEFQSLAPLPDLPEEAANGEGDQNAEEAENTEVLARLKDLSKGASKRVVKRPQPKLDPERLTGERGIAILPKVFEKVKFKGKGHEAEDLGVIMHHLEHWGHRLFPKMPFDEVLQRIERLGSKKEVQTCIKKIRMDMPVLNVDFLKDDDEEDNVKRGNKGESPAPAPVVDVDAEDVWEEIMKEEKEKRSQESLPASQPHQTPQTPAQQPVPSNHLTPEQLERIEQNKRLALERKAKKFGTPLPSTASPSQKQLTLTPSETGTQNDKGRDEQNSSVNISSKNEDENLQETVKAKDTESELNLKGAKYCDDEHKETDYKSDTPVSSTEVVDNNVDVEMDMELDQDQLMDELDN